MDRPHRAIVRVLEAAGCTVVDLSGVGEGCPDLLVGYMRISHLLEVKDREGEAKNLLAKGSTARVARGQLRFRERWRGRPVHVVRSPAEALRAVGIVGRVSEAALGDMLAPEIVAARRSPRRRKVLLEA